MKANINLKTDRSLMYLIQNITKLPTSDILGFFNDLVTQVTHIGLANREKTGSTGIRKDICDYFPNSPVPFKLLIKGRPGYSHTRNPDGSWTKSENLEFNAHAEVGFPNQTDYVDQNKLSEIIAEKMLLGGSDLPPFERPATKTPKLYKDLMAEIQSRRMV